MTKSILLSKVFSTLFILLINSSVFAAQHTILVLGDSLSAAYGMAQAEGWVHKLSTRLQAQAPQYQVVNTSITGETTHGGLTRLPSAIITHKPEVLIIALGGNDGLRGLSLHQAKLNISNMVLLARENKSRVLLLGVKLPQNYGQQYNKQFHRIYTDTAAQMQVPIVDFFLQGVAETPELMQADGIHPSKRAQARILENVWPELEKLLTKTHQ